MNLFCFRQNIDNGVVVMAEIAVANDDDDNYNDVDDNTIVLVKPMIRMMHVLVSFH